jgi:hypothetical protein
LSTTGDDSCTLHGPLANSAYNAVNACFDMTYSTQDELTRQEPFQMAVHLE